MVAELRPSQPATRSTAARNAPNLLFAVASLTGARKICVASRCSIHSAGNSLMNELGVHGIGLPYLIRCRHHDSASVRRDLPPGD